MRAGNNSLMVRRPLAVSNHEGSSWRDRGTASWFEPRFALLTMRLVAGSLGILEKRP